MLRETKRELEKMKCIKSYIDDALSKAPKGKLKCIINKGCFQYYCDKKYLRKEQNSLAMAIAHRDYYEKLSVKVDTYIAALQKLLIIYECEELETVYRNLSLGRKALIKPVIKPIEDVIKEFEAIECVGKGFDEQDVTEYYTMKNERVRSKSEKIIADEFYMQQIPYHYEMPLQLENRGRIITIYPDFTALNKRTGKRWIIEHLGMMDKEAYYESTMYKLDLYKRNGWLQGKNLILLHESSTAPLNTMVVKQYIEEYLC